LQDLRREIEEEGEEAGEHHQLLSQHSFARLSKSQQSSHFAFQGSISPTFYDQLLLVQMLWSSTSISTTMQRPTLAVYSTRSYAQPLRSLARLFCSRAKFENNFSSRAALFKLN